MSWGFISIMLVVVVVAAAIFSVLIMQRENPLIKKYYKYAVIILPAVFLILIRILSKKRTEKREDTLEQNSVSLMEAIGSIKEDLNEANMTAAIEVTVAKTKDSEKIKELEQVVKIEDKRERRRRLAQMIG